MKKWAYSIIFFIFSTEAYAQSSWLDSAKNVAAKTWKATQRAFIYDDRPLRGFAEPLRQLIRQSVAEENQRFHGAHEASIERRQKGSACDALRISHDLETDFINNCTILEIHDSCNTALNESQSYFSDITLPSSNVSDKELIGFHKGLIKNLKSIIKARESCYEVLSVPLVDGHSSSCKQSLETTLNGKANAVAAVCTEERFNSEIELFIDKMTNPKGPAAQIFEAKQKYIQIRETELKLASDLLSLTKSIQSRLPHKRATASSEFTQEQKAK